MLLNGGLMEEPRLWCGDDQLCLRDEATLPRLAAADAAEQECQIEALYRTHAKRLLRRFGRDAGGEDASDLLHDAFYRLVRLGAGRLRSVQRAEAYLNSIASNLLRDRAKAARRHSAAGHEPLAEERMPGHDQQRLLEQRDLLNRLDQAMLRLKPKTREIFMAHRLDGLSYAEIAAHTGLSVKGVEKHMCKAIAQLDRSLHRS
jgi:RNA polymerase sigma factor (sigma-70 family)